MLVCQRSHATPLLRCNSLMPCSKSLVRPFADFLDLQHALAFLESLRHHYLENITSKHEQKTKQRAEVSGIEH